MPVEWIVILAARKVLANIGLSARVKPYATGGALMLLAAEYPLVAASGASSPTGALGAGATGRRGGTISSS